MCCFSMTINTFNIILMKGLSVIILELNNEAMD